MAVWLLCSGAAWAQDKMAVQVSVTDTNGEPLPGATVVEAGTRNSATADVNGKCTITVPVNATLEVSFLGYTTQRVTATRAAIEVRLEESGAVSLDEAVVVGFSTQKKVNLTGAIASVGADVFENRPVSNVGQALQGVLPNLSVSISSGQPDAVPSFALRGGATMEQDANDSNKWKVFNKSPLILVDGVEYSATMLNQMNPNDIESTTLIKDASAAAIYGTKATYGVMLITTKSGRFGQEGQISYSYDLSFDSPSAIPNVLDSWTIQRAYMDKKSWTGQAITAADEDKLAAMKNYMDNPKPENAYYMVGNIINWVATMNPYDVLLKDYQTTHKHNLNFRGGAEKIAYYVSLGYQNENGLYRIGDESYDRYNALARINAKIKKWFNLEARASYGYTKYEAPFIAGGKGTVWNALKGGEITRNINAPIRTGPNDPLPNIYTDNILGWMAYGAKSETVNTTTTLSIKPELIITPWLKAIGEFSYTPQTANYNRHSPKRDHVLVDQWTSTTPPHGADENRAYFYKRTTDSYLINTYFDVNKTWGQHNLTATLGFSQESMNYEDLEAELRKLFSADIQNESVSIDPTLNQPFTDASRRSGRAGFGRLGYIYNNRYLFEMNGRYDGSSRFPKNNRFVFFPSFSAGWIISEEQFMEFSRSWLDHLKFKGSWGELGSQPSSNYPYQELLGSGATNYYIGDAWATYLSTPRLSSASLTWQKATTLNLGFDAVFLKDRLSAEFSWFERKVTDILLEGDIPYPAVLGVPSTEMPKVNSGSMRSYGFELVLGWRDRLENGLSYKVGVTLSDQRTQVLSFPKNATKALDTPYDGMYTGSIWGYETGGILQESDLEKLPNGTYKYHGPNMNGNSTYWPGYLWYKDLNGDGLVNVGKSTADDPGDRKIIGNSTPRYQYGITADLAWKGFDLNLFFQGIGKRDIWINDNAYWGGDNTAGSRFMYENSWRPDRADAKFPMYALGVGGNAQTAYLFSGAYLRLKQVVLGYTLPEKLTAKAGISKLRVSVSAFNLFTITDIPDVFDPDQISSAYPQKKTIAFGAQITF